MPICPNCQQDNPPDAANCEACGAPLHEPTPTIEGHFPDDESHDNDSRRQLAAEIGTLVSQGRAIEAIKRYREETGCSLVEAKEAIDAIKHKHGLTKKSGCAGMVLLGMTLASSIAAAVMLRFIV